jgi:hypothetical protein
VLSPEREHLRVGARRCLCGSSHTKGLPVTGPAMSVSKGAILRKLDVRTRGEAGAQAARRGLIPHG